MYRLRLPIQSIIIYNKCLLGHFLNREPLFGRLLSSHTEAQKKRDIQKRTAKKICTLSWNLEKDATRPVSTKRSSEGLWVSILDKLYQSKEKTVSQDSYVIDKQFYDQMWTYISFAKVNM